METNLGKQASTWNSDLGCFVSDSHVQLAAALHDYNPYFSLVFIPPKDRTLSDTKPWAILDSSPAVAPYIIRYLSDREMKDTKAVLAWVFEGDLSKQRPVDVFDRIQSRERAEKILKLKAREDELGDAAEFAEYVFGSRSPNTFRHKGREYRK